jgi:hypothetical protein
MEEERVLTDLYITRFHNNEMRFIHSSVTMATLIILGRKHMPSCLVYSLFIINNNKVFKNGSSFSSVIKKDIPIDLYLSQK